MGSKVERAEFLPQLQVTTSVRVFVKCIVNNEQGICLPFTIVCYILQDIATFNSVEEDPGRQPCVSVTTIGFNQMYFT